MKRLFIHHIAFRLLSPLATGCLVYLLILLANNNVEQIQEYFLSEELYICIFLAFLIQEFARISVVVYKKVNWADLHIGRMFIQFMISIGITCLLVSITMQIYFRIHLGYTPNGQELLLFNFLFSIITFLYLLLYTGHELLYKLNIGRLEAQEVEELKVSNDFASYKEEVNTDLLFHCLESLIILGEKDAEMAEELTNKFASLYRYTLAKKKEELVPLIEELEIVKKQIDVYGHLPFRKVTLSVKGNVSGYTIPLSLVRTVERIIKTTIPTVLNNLEILIDFERDDVVAFKYKPKEKLDRAMTTTMLSDLAKKYKFYSDLNIVVDKLDDLTTISLPRIQIL